MRELGPTSMHLPTQGYLTSVVVPSLAPWNNMDVAHDLPRYSGVLSDMVVPWNLEYRQIFFGSGSSRTIASSHNLLPDLALLIIRPVKDYIHAGQISAGYTAAPGFDRKQEMLLDNSSFRLGYGF
jgi:hypothetical protein